MADSKTSQAVYSGSVKGIVEFVKHGNQEPHLSVLAGRWEGPREGYCCCAAHTLFEERFPQLAPLTKWHLCGISTGPMHYEANAIFWAEMAQGKHERKIWGPDPVKVFKSTVVWGAVATDGTDADALVTMNLTNDELTGWLRARLPALMAEFHAQVETAFPGMWEKAENLGPKCPGHETK